MIIPPEPVTGFKSVIDFRRRRSWQAALGFYFFHLAAGMILAGILSTCLGLIIGATTYQQGFDLGVRFGRIISTFYCTAVYAAIIHVRQAWKNPWYLGGLAITFAVGAAGAGSLMSLFPAAATLGITPPEKNGSSHD